MESTIARYPIMEATVVIPDLRGLEGSSNSGITLLTVECEVDLNIMEPFR
jgi:hypothetical protein